MQDGQEVARADRSALSDDLLGDLGAVENRPALAKGDGWKERLVGAAADLIYRKADRRTMQRDGARGRGHARERRFCALVAHLLHMQYAQFSPGKYNLLAGSRPSGEEKYLLGYEDVRIYYASWAEWGTAADTPVET